MKTLGLFRHAKSDWGDPRARDFDRPLNPRGRKGAAVMGLHIRDWCRESRTRWDRVLSSPAVRCAETVEIAASTTPEGAQVGYAVNWDRRIYLASSATLIDVLRELDDSVGSVMMVGHNPGLEDLIFDLVPDDGTCPLRDVVEDKFPTATFAVLEIDTDQWERIDAQPARIVHLMRPRDIDAGLGPAGPG